MKSRVIQDDPDDGGPPQESQPEPRPGEPPPEPARLNRSRLLARVVAWFRKGP